MSFEQIPRFLTIRVLETNEKALMGTYAMTENSELAHMVLTIHKRGFAGGSERFKINVYSEQDTLRNTPIYQSSDHVWVEDGEYWVGRIRFDFSGEHLQAGKSYIMELEAQNYTRNADDFYFAYVLDHPAQLYDRAVSDETGAQLAILGRKF